MTIEYRNGEWCTVHCHGANKGKSIACFQTKGDAMKQHAAIMSEKANKIEINLTTIQKAEETKAWRVLWAGGRAVVYFEDEADADYYVSSGKGEPMFEFVNKRLVDIPKKKSGSKYRIRPKGTKIKFKHTED